MAVTVQVLKDSTVFERVRKVIVHLLKVSEDEVTMEIGFTGLGADSTDVIELIMAVEEEFGISIPDEDADRLRTVCALVGYVQLKLDE